MSPFWEAMVTIAVAVIGLGTMAVLVSKNAQTPQVIQSAASGFGNVLGVAEAPVTGSNISYNLTYPGTDMSGSFGYG